MAVEDTIVYFITWKVAFPIFFACYFLKCVLRKMPDMKLYFTACINEHYFPHRLHIPVCVKSRIFSGRLKRMRSADWSLRNRGLIRILEIGVGEGRNFEYFPNNCRIILLEPNPFTRKNLIKNLESVSHVKIERFLEGRAENMSPIEDASVDAVIVTGVLCTVSNIDRALMEVLRVLAPGGQLLYAEHCCCLKSNAFERLLQHVISPVWKIVFGGCDLTRDVLGAIHRSPFRRSAHCTFRKKDEDGYYLDNFLLPVVIGYAVK